MSSRKPTDYLTAVDLNMVARVLDRAGYYGSKNEVDTNFRQHASRFLLELVRSGVKAEKDLVAALEARDILAARERFSPQQDRLEPFGERTDDIGRLISSSRSIH